MPTANEVQNATLANKLLPVFRFRTDFLEEQLLGACPNKVAAIKRAVKEAAKKQKAQPNTGLLSAADKVQKAIQVCQLFAQTASEAVGSLMPQEYRLTSVVLGLIWHNPGVSQEAERAVSEICAQKNSKAPKEEDMTSKVKALGNIVAEAAVGGHDVRPCSLLHQKSCVLQCMQCVVIRRWLALLD